MNANHPFAFTQTRPHGVDAAVRVIGIVMLNRAAHAPPAAIRFELDRGTN